MLKTYRICNLTIEFLKCEFNNKLLSSVNPTLFFDGSYGFTLVLYSSYIASLHPRNLPKGFFFFSCEWYRYMWGNTLFDYKNIVKMVVLV